MGSLVLFIALSMLISVSLASVCPTNEEFSNCTQSLCRALKCSQRGKSIACPRVKEESCEKGCVCKSGFLRTKYGSCIPEERCYGNLVCRDDEVVDTCPGACNKDFCPKSESESICPITNSTTASCGKPRCKCGFNSRRNNDNGTCIPTRDCPPFDCSSQNEEYNSCPPLCPTDSCSQASPSGRCPILGRIGIVLECNPKCRCIQGYWRNNGICVPYAKCPGICPKNEEFSNCTQAVCRAQNCTQKGRPIACSIIAEGSCLQGCICVEGTLRAENGSCIPEDQCPSKHESTCPSNEQFSECTQAVCRAQNCQQKGRPVACPGIAEGSCIKGCVCAPGYLRNDEGKCVPEDQCPPREEVCPSNEEFSNCTQSLCRPLKCCQRGKSIACPRVKEESCKKGCVCKSGFLRTKYGSCIPEDRCYGKLVCREDEIVDTCPGVCNKDYCPTRESESICSITNSTTQSCGKPRCKCSRFNYRKINNTGTCIPTRDCPPFDCSSQNEEYNSCPPLCPTDSCSQASPSGRCPFGRIGIILECNPKCRCIQGYWRNNGTCVPYAKCPGICPKNEEFSNCTQAECRAQNCTQKGRPIACPMIAKGSCLQGCICVEGTLRAENGSCIPEDQCPSKNEDGDGNTTCGENEEFSQCPSMCKNDTCPKSVKELNDEKGKLCMTLCGPAKCNCKDKFKRDSTGKCIPIGECPGICQNPNEEYTDCVQAAPCIQNCTQTYGPTDCPEGKPDVCDSGCICAPGFLRNENGVCVPESDCQNDENPVCGEHEEFVRCPSVCEKDACPKSIKELNDEKNTFCILVCGKAKCSCKPNYRRDSTGKCIPIGDCPGICQNANEEYTNCVQTAPCIQNCTQKYEATECPEGKPDVCDSGCICAPGFLRNENGVCVPESYCQKQLQCGKNEVASCVQDCPPEKTCETRGIQFNCLESNKKCQLKCVCKKGFYRNGAGECITGEECDMCKGQNEFFTCGSACDNECSKLATQNSTNCPILNIMCNRTCYCKDGFARDNNKICVPIDEYKCNVNEEYRNCKTVCPPELCFSLVARFKCKSNPTCEPGCACKSGFLRKDEKSPCEPICDCSEMKNLPDCQKN